MTFFKDDQFFPRARGNSFWRDLVEKRTTSLDTLAEQPFTLSTADFHPAGNLRVSESELREWREDLNRWAYDNGFPSAMNAEQRNAWDVDLGVKLISDVQLMPEARHPDVWCWIAVNLLPHFIVHRWGWPNNKDGSSPEGSSKWARFGPTGRNGLILAINRVELFGEDIARKAQQEEFQSIQYRSSYSLDPRVARVVMNTLIDSRADESSSYARNGGTVRIDANLIGIQLWIANSMRPLCFVDNEEIQSIIHEIMKRLPELRGTDVEAVPLREDEHDDE